jgi:hypothetical protein
MSKTTWRQEISESMEAVGEGWDAVVGHTLTSEELDREFDSGFGTSQGCPFTLWTNNRVYFPVVYDGCEWVESVPRNPCNEATEHKGGQ